MRTFITRCPQDCRSDNPVKTKSRIEDKKTGFDRISATFSGLQMEPVPKGELWLGTGLLERAGFRDDLAGHINLVKQLDQDMISLPLARHSHVNKVLGYRYFSAKEIQEASETTDLFVTAVIDGPFQRLVEKEGLIRVLTGWGIERENVLKAYEDERINVLGLLMDCLEHSAHGIVIADDLAGDRHTFLSPDDIERFFSPFYIDAVLRIHEKNGLALFHSCGSIRKLIPQLITWGFDGLAAVQDGTNDLGGLKAKHGSDLVLMAGIDGELLEKEELPPSELETLNRRCRSLARNGGFILSSSCGLYRGRFLERIRKIYSITTRPQDR